MQVSVIIPAAGCSQRFGALDKLEQDLGGRMVLVRVAETFTRRSEVSQIIVAGPPDDFETFRERFGATLSFYGVTLVEGGRAERWETVKKALSAVDADATHIAVHDAARPALSDALLDRLFEAAGHHPAVIPVLPITDTLKRMNAEETRAAAAEDDAALIDSILGEETRSEITTRCVIDTVDRSQLYRVQTPQIFHAELLRRAYDQPDLDGVTDDAALVERLGETVQGVEGDPRNIKITTPNDLDMVRDLLHIKPPAERPVHKRF